MAVNPLAPGVYIDEIPVLAPSVAPVATAIPAFIGYTKKQPSPNLPVRITSMVEFELHFGGAFLEENMEVAIVDTVSGGNLVSRSITAGFNGSGISAFKLYNSMQLYFSNGGGPCYISSAGIYPTTPALVPMQTALTAVGKLDEPTLLVFPDATGLPLNDYATLVGDARAQCAKLQDRFTIIDLHGNDINPTGNLSAFRTALGMQNLKYGAVYTPFLRTVLSYAYDETKTDISYNDGTSTTNGTLNTFNTGGANENLLVYNLSKQALDGVRVVLPPCGGVAGIYASVDRDRGVWKAPANVSVNSVIDPTISITEAQNGDLNIDPTGGKSINAIRAFTGKGTLVWGARTLAGNDNEWRYVNVRRLFIFAEESIKKATEFVVFEPNDANTWTRLKALITNFLTNLWRDGALVGAKPEQAFFVKVGLNETMTAQDILEGKCIIQVGLAASRPAEFIILQFMHKLQES